MLEAGDKNVKSIPNRGRAEERTGESTGPEQGQERGKKAQSIDTASGRKKRP